MGFGVSYGFFCRQKPFWVVVPNERDRETCMCKTHENFQFIANAMFKVGLLETSNVEDIAASTMCDKGSKMCAYNECPSCKETACELKRQPTQDNVTFSQWCQQKTDQSFITVKQEQSMTESDLNDHFQDRLAKFRKHVFNIQWQYRAYRNLKENLSHNECLIHVDFSENYTCKYAKEIQSMHFGGSHDQATLHTGVYYLQSRPDATSFCSISESRRHDPAAIWAHLAPVLTSIKSSNPHVDTLHVFSDGPATQYRQKANFYMLSQAPFDLGSQRSHGISSKQAMGKVHRTV